MASSPQRPWKLGGPDLCHGGPNCRPNPHESEDNFSCSRCEKVELPAPILRRLGEDVLPVK